MTRMKPLLERNEQFARIYTPVPLGLPAGPATSPCLTQIDTVGPRAYQGQLDAATIGAIRPAA